jgi:hypothetical protein
MCWQQHAGVGDQFSAFSACKRTRDGAVGEAPSEVAQATSPGMERSVGARGNQSAAEIANGYLCAALDAFGCSLAALATSRDQVLDKAGPPRVVKRVLGSPRNDRNTSMCGDSLGRKAEEERSKAFWAVARCVL